jgi:GNAT superfamily N-acetyltransferase
MTGVTLRPMSDAEFGEFVAASQAGVVEQMVEMAGTDREAALTRADAEYRSLLPQGSATPGHEFRLAADERGDVVGHLWVGLKDGPGPAIAWVYDVEVAETHRGRGLGRAIMEAAEDLAREMGAASLGLNVFGGNAVARALYDKLGYVVTSQQMSKPLR